MKFAFGHDELKPVSKGYANWVGSHGLAATIIDALDTLWIMNMKDEFKQAKKYVAEKLTFDQAHFRFCCNDNLYDRMFLCRHSKQTFEF